MCFELFCQLVTLISSGADDLNQFYYVIAIIFQKIYGRIHFVYNMYTFSLKLIRKLLCQDENAVFALDVRGTCIVLYHIFLRKSKQELCHGT